MKLTDEKYAELEAANGGASRVRRFETDLGTVVVRKPSRAETRAAVAKGLLDQTFTKTLDAADPLLRQCRVHPTAQQLDEWIEERPLIPLAAAGLLIELVSGGVAEEVKK